MESIAQKMKNEAYIKGLEADGVNVDALMNDLKKKQDGNVTGISK
jgi:hypothetical protein